MIFEVLWFHHLALLEVGSSLWVTNLPWRKFGWTIWFGFEHNRDATTSKQTQLIVTKSFGKILKSDDSLTSHAYYVIITHEKFQFVWLNIK